MIIDPDEFEPLTFEERQIRLWAYLQGLGLYTYGITDPDNPDRVDCLIVSVEKPKLHISVASEVSLPVEGAEVEEGVGPSLRFGDNVIEFPPKD